MTEKRTGGSVGRMVRGEIPRQALVTSGRMKHGRPISPAPLDNQWAAFNSESHPTLGAVGNGTPQSRPLRNSEAT